ncbi:MAG: DUF2079 domain-containing protein [bacterium]|nr:DUF2079 domain-containing protein [bacterium]
MRQNLRATAWLATLVLIFTIAISAVGFWKYAYYRYQGMDLAIYTNVLWSLAHGGGWWSSIQGSSYLGDHVEPILLLIAPLFRLWSDPRWLIVLQALALGLTAVPVYLLLRSGAGNPKLKTLNPKQAQSAEVQKIRFLDLFRVSILEFRFSQPALLAGLWLLNPLLWNAALFEFHALALSPLFLLSAAYAYVRRRFWWFFLWMLLSLSVREDVALIVVMFGVVAFVERWSDNTTSPPSRAKRDPEPSRDWRGSERGWGWVLAPLVLGCVWFLLATRIAAAHSASGAYKFLIYYGWLRDAASHPLAFLQHIVSIGNIDMVIGLLLPFLFLPFLRARWLLLAVPSLLQIFLAGPGGSSVVVETHYALLFLPALMCASIDAMRTISSPLAEGERSAPARASGEGVGARTLPFVLRGSGRGCEQSRVFQWLARRFPLPRTFAIPLGIAVYLAAAWLIGPFPGIVRIAVQGASLEDRMRRAAYDELLTKVPSDAPIAVGYAALPHVAARRGAYALPYAYLGVTQYGLASYKLPDTTRYLLLDQRDAITYAVQFPGVGWTAPHAAGGPERLRTLIERGRFGVVAERDGVALLEHDVGGVLPAAQYFIPNTPPRGHLAIDGLRDVTILLDE